MEVKMKFKNNVVVVTGGTRGIGRAIVEEFAAQGAHVLFTYTASEAAAKEISQNLSKKKQIVSGHKINVCDYDSLSKWRESIIEKYKKIDVLVNNAGIIRDKALMMMTRQD
jgi:3-oxoacyl-[acyl-carrier protein] reductase